MLKSLILNRNNGSKDASTKNAIITPTKKKNETKSSYHL